LQEVISSHMVTGHGMDVRFCQMPTRSSAAVFTVLAGYGKEKPLEYGLSHLVEHMSFKGSSSGDSDRITKELALCGADWNATTSPYLVNYHLHCPSENMPRALAVLADVFFSNPMSDEDLSKEKKIVAAEAADRDDDPFSSFHSQAIEHHLHSAIGHSCLGKKASVKKFTINDLLNFRKRHYRAKNSALSVCGGFDIDEVTDVIDSFPITDHWSEGKKEHVSCNPWRHGAKKGLSLQTNLVKQANLMILFTAPGILSKKMNAYKILISMLGGGGYSLLNKRIREELAMCYYISADDEMFLRSGDFSMGSIEMSCSTGKLDKAMDEIVVCTKMLAEGNFDSEILECARQSRMGALCDLADSAEGTAFINVTRAVFGEERCFNMSDMVRDYLSVSKNDIIESAREFLNDDNFRFTTLAPSKNK
jgi:predicted Zn-dependent peptidase